MPRSYLMSRKWSMTNRFTITDETGAPQFEVQGKSAFSARLSIIDSSGALAASITGRAFSSRYEIQSGGLTTPSSGRAASSGSVLRSPHPRGRWRPGAISPSGPTL